MEGQGLEWSCCRVEQERPWWEWQQPAPFVKGASCCVPLLLPWSSGKRSSRCGPLPMTAWFVGQSCFVINHDIYSLSVFIIFDSLRIILFDNCFNHNVPNVCQLHIRLKRQAHGLIHLHQHILHDNLPQQTIIRGRESDAVDQWCGVGSDVAGWGSVCACQDVQKGHFHSHCSLQTRFSY